MISVASQLSSTYSTHSNQPFAKHGPSRFQNVSLVGSITVIVSEMSV